MQEMKQVQDKLLVAEKRICDSVEEISLRREMILESSKEKRQYEKRLQDLREKLETMRDGVIE